MKFKGTVCLFNQVTHRQIYLYEGKESSGTVGIDDTLERHITFFFYFFNDVPFIDLFSPSGVLYDVDDSNTYLDTELNIVKFHFDFVEVKCVELIT